MEAALLREPESLLWSAWMNGTRAVAAGDAPPMVVCGFHMEPTRLQHLLRLEIRDEPRGRGRVCGEAQPRDGPDTRDMSGGVF